MSVLYEDEVKPRGRPKLAPEPNYPGLSIPGPAPSKKTASFYKACQAFEKRLSEMLDRRTRLLASGMDLTVKEVLKTSGRT